MLSTRSRWRALIGLPFAVWFALFAPGTAMTAAAQNPDPTTYQPEADLGPDSVVAHPLQAKVTAASSSTSPVILSGELLDSTGRAIAQQAVTVTLEVSDATLASIPDGDPIPTVRLGQSQTLADGSFTVRAPYLTEMSSFANQDGTYNVMVSALDADVSAMYHLDVRSAAGGGWRSGPAEPAVDGSPAAGSRADGAASVTRATKVTVQSGPPTIELVGSAPGAAPSSGIQAAAIDPWDYCGAADYYYWVVGSNTLKDWVKIQRIHTAAKSTVTYDWYNDRQSRMDIAGKAGPNGALVGVGLTYASQEASGTNFGVPNNAFVDLEAEFTFRPYNLYCQYTWTGESWYSGYYEWRPRVFTIGNQLAAVSTADFTCNAAYKSTISNPAWVSQSTTMTYSVGFDFGGAGSFRSSQSNTNGYKVTYDPNTGQTATLCGNGAVVSQANQVQELQETK